MHQSITICICFLQLALCNVAPFRNKRLSGVPPNWTGDDAGDSAAEKFLLRGSSELYRSPRAVIYERLGSRLSAVADFYALKPINVRHVNKITETEIHGQVGKQLVVLTTGKRRSNGKDTFPQISITSFEPGKDTKYNFKMKVFWYLGGYLDSQTEI